VNVATQSQERSSILNLYRRLIAVRRATPELIWGSYCPLKVEGDLLLFARRHDSDRVLVALNLGAEAMAINFGSDQLKGRVLVSTLGDRDGETLHSRIDLRGFDGLLIKLDQDTTLPGAQA
jgi:alpha-glucosidase